MEIIMCSTSLSLYIKETFNHSGCCQQGRHVRNSLHERTTRVRPMTHQRQFYPVSLVLGGRECEKGEELMWPNMSLLDEKVRLCCPHLQVRNGCGYTWYVGENHEWQHNLTDSREMLDENHYRRRSRTESDSKNDTKPLIRDVTNATTVFVLLEKGISCKNRIK
ncbi:hypothetical protein YC2023_119582 [Brassica napus]